MDLKDKKILHFEDEAYIAEMYAGLLKNRGINYRHYLSPPKSGEEFINLAAEENPDLILMDVMMPGINGFKAAEILKANERTKHIPIIGMSNMWQEEEIKKALDSGMVDFLGKVFFKPGELVDLIVEFLEKGDNYAARCRRYL